MHNALGWYVFLRTVSFGLVLSLGSPSPSPEEKRSHETEHYPIRRSGNKAKYPKNIFHVLFLIILLLFYFICFISGAFRSLPFGYGCGIFARRFGQGFFLPIILFAVVPTDISVHCPSLLPTLLNESKMHSPPPSLSNPRMGKAALAHICSSTATHNPPCPSLSNRLHG